MSAPPAPAALSNQEALKERKLGALHQALAMYRSRLGLEFVHGAWAGSSFAFVLRQLRSRAPLTLIVWHRLVLCWLLCTQLEVVLEHSLVPQLLHPVTHTRASWTPPFLAAGEGDGEQLRCIFTQVNLPCQGTWAGFWFFSHLLLCLLDVLVASLLLTHPRPLHCMQLDPRDHPRPFQFAVQVVGDNSYAGDGGT